MVKWTRPAKRDLKKIHDYIAKVQDIMQKKSDESWVKSSIKEDVSSQ